MSRSRLRFWLGTLALVAGLWVATRDEAAADAPLTDTFSVAINCQPINLSTLQADGGYSSATTSAVLCGGGYRALNLETESTTPIRICQRNGATPSNYTTVCVKRCVGCNNGSRYVVDQNQRHAESKQALTRCISEGADAGVSVIVACGK